MRIAAATLLLLVGCVGCGSSKPAEGPKPDERIQALETELATAKEALAKANAAAEALRKTEAELKGKADEAAALQTRLAEAVGASGEVTTADGAVKLELVDQILFPTGEADLTANGKEVLAKVGAALKEIGDKQIWVQGHTDDQPIYARKPKTPDAKDAKDSKDSKHAKAAAAAEARTGKRAKPAKAAEAKPAKLARAGAGRAAADDAKAATDVPESNDAVLPYVTNWELSAARALTVVHYLQDEAKLEPARLAAVAFGQYRPVSRTRSKNRRIEIVLYPRAKIAPK